MNILSLMKGVHKFETVLVENALNCLTASHKTNHN